MSIRLAFTLLMAGLLAAAGLFAYGWREALADPVVRRAHIRLPDWPRGAAPVRVALVSDIHMENGTMDEPRLDAIVEAVNAARPDLVVLAGDFIEGRGVEEARRAIPRLAGPLGRLRARYGVVATIGNHDLWTDPMAVATMLRRAGIAVLDGTAVRRGPLRLAGLGYLQTKQPFLDRAAAALAQLPGAAVMVAHSPEIVGRMPADVHLLLAGHTHCGQIDLPLIGPPLKVVEERLRCGLARRPGYLTVVTAGVGTSNLPVRLRVPPDWWLLTLGP